MAFLDVVSNALAAILLVYLLIAGRAQMSRAEMAGKRFVLLSATAVALDEHNQPLSDVKVHVRIEAIMPPVDADGRTLPATPNAAWRPYRLPQSADELVASGLCQTATAEPSGPDAFCVLQGVARPTCLLRLTFFSPSDHQDAVRRLDVRGWIADPTGRRTLDEAVVPGWSSQITSGGPAADNVWSTIWVVQAHFVADEPDSDDR